jgi:hypothetical protein
MQQVIDLWPAGNAADGTPTYSWEMSQVMSRPRAQVAPPSLNEARDAIAVLGLTFLVGGVVLFAVSAAMPRE